MLLCDFVIYEPERRKGYASKALNLMEKNAAEFGCQESVLLVANENEAAKKSYANQGYVF